jgi:UDP-N-acetylmuramoyl-tripeptide--D-alanyl-D-alanine ligase
MRKRTLADVAAVVGGRAEGDDVAVTSVVTDSRARSAGALFVALRGERHDGHGFIDSAWEHGAVAALVERADAVPSGLPAIVVSDTGRALLTLAADEREHMPEVRVVAITGANGKTSTKDLAAAVCGQRYRTHASPRSFNNEVGLPLTLLDAPEGSEVIVAEMGARREGDVALLCEIARPDVAVVTNLGVAHMEIFGSWEAIERASAEPLEALDADSVAVLNADDSVVRGYASRTRGRVVTFGTSEDADVRAVELEMDADARASFVLEADGASEPVTLAVPGEHMVSNALAAAASGIALGISPAECAGGLKDARVSAWRMETTTNERGVVVVNDAYNANPESMTAGLKAARWIARGRRLVAVLGHMAELGPISLEEHERLGALVVRVGVERLVTVGDLARPIARAALREGQLPEDLASYDLADDAIEDVRAWAREGDVVFLKGSRVAALERVAEALA